MKSEWIQVHRVKLFDGSSLHLQFVCAWRASRRNEEAKLEMIQQQLWENERSKAHHHPQIFPPMIVKAMTEMMESEK